MKNLLIISIFLTLLLSCGSDISKEEIKEETVQDKILKESDTITENVIIKGESKILSYTRRNEFIVKKAIELSNMEDPLSYRTVLFEDVTNDGIKDSLIWSLYSSKKGYGGNFSIKVNGATKWYESYSIDTSSQYYSGNSIFWLGDSANFEMLKPYSQMAILALYEIKPNMIKLYESVDTESDIRTNIEFSTWISGDKFTEKELDSLAKYMRNYKGKVVSEPSYNREPYYLYWIDYDSRFIVMYYPTNSAAFFIKSCITASWSLL